MPKEETKPDGFDSLDEAAGKISKVDDSQLALDFIKANEKALNQETTPVVELFTEDKKIYEDKDLSPTPELVKSLYDSITVKEIHHKKLLEETDKSNFFYKAINKIKEFFNVSIHKSTSVSLVNEDSKVFSCFLNYWAKDSKTFFSNLGSLLDLWLRNPRKRKTLFKTEFFLMCLFSLFSILSISLLSGYSVSTSLANSWIWTIISFSIISLLLCFTPIFFFLSLWFVNVNHLHSSKNFHILLLSIYTVAGFFSLLAIFNCTLFFILDSFFNL